MATRGMAGIYWVPDDPTVWVDGTGGKIITPDAMDRMIRAGEVKLIGRTWSTCVIADKATGGQITFTRVREDREIV